MFIDKNINATIKKLYDKKNLGTPKCLQVDYHIHRKLEDLQNAKLQGSYGEVLYKLEQRCNITL